MEGDPLEYDMALDILAGIIADAYLEGRLDKYLEPRANARYKEPNEFDG